MAKDGGKGGSPGRPTPGWDKDWPPKPKPQPKPKLAKKNKKKKAKEPDWTIEDNYAKYASKFKRDPRTEANA